MGTDYHGWLKMLQKVIRVIRDSLLMPRKTLLSSGLRLWHGFRAAAIIAVAFVRSMLDRRLERVMTRLRLRLSVPSIMLDEAEPGLPTCGSNFIRADRSR
jgi:hypothetical protein